MICDNGISGPWGIAVAVGALLVLMAGFAIIRFSVRLYPTEPGAGWELVAGFGGLLVFAALLLGGGQVLFYAVGCF